MPIPLKFDRTGHPMNWGTAEQDYPTSKTDYLHAGITYFPNLNNYSTIKIGAMTRLQDYNSYNFYVAIVETNNLPLSLNEFKNLSTCETFSRINQVVTESTYTIPSVCKDSKSKYVIISCDTAYWLDGYRPVISLYYELYE